MTSQHLTRIAFSLKVLRHKKKFDHYLTRKRKKKTMGGFEKPNGQVKLT